MARKSRSLPADPVTAYATAVVTKTTVAGRLVRLACQRHLRDLTEHEARGLTWRPDQAQVAIDFFERILCLPDEVDEGQDAIASTPIDDDDDTPSVGKPFLLSPFQKFIIGSLCGWFTAAGRQRFRMAFIETGKGAGKALALDTPIPTPAGWTTMGAIQVGDRVFDERGRTVPVVGVSGAMTDHECFEVVFDDGTVIVADADHLWFTEQRTFSRLGERLATAGVKRSERGRWRKGIRTTSDVAQSLRYCNGKYQSANHSVPLAGPLGLPGVELPVEPYVLGVWLGDGDSDCARVTIGDQDVELIEHLTATGTAVGGRQGPAEKAGRYRLGGRPTDSCHRGHPRATDTRNGHCRACERERDRAARRGAVPSAPTLLPLAAHLRSLGILDNKHMPAMYLRAAVDQRLALLQGLMDTDGSIDKSSGACEFSSTNQALADGVFELLMSLGIKASCRERPAKLNGRVVSSVWRIAFHPAADLPVFRLRRKLQHQRVRHCRRRLSGDRRIVNVRPCASVPVRCIAVDTPSHLYLAGRSMVPTHNTPLAAGLLLFRIAVQQGVGKQSYVAATMKDQARLTFTDAVNMVKASPHLRNLLTVTVNSIANIKTGSFIKPVSAEEKGLDGKRVDGAVADEVQEQRTGIVIEKLRAGIKNRQDALILLTLNSGFDTTSIAWELHEYSQRVLDGVVENDVWFAYVCQLDPCEACYEKGKRVPQDSCPHCDQWHTEGQHWLKVNPNLGVSLPWEYLRDQVKQALGMPGQQALVMRLNFCIWTAQHTIWIPADKWLACQVPRLTTRNDKRLPATMGLDLSTTTDLTAGVITLRDDDPSDQTPDVIEIATTDEVTGEPLKKTLNLNYCVEVLPFFWMPEDKLRERVQKDRIPFDVWKKDGHLQTTLGPIVDYDQIYDDIVKRHEPTYRIQQVGYDPYNATQFAINLRDRAKLTVVEVKQGKVLTEAAKLLFALVLSGRLRHGGNPVMAWCVANAMAEYDKYENISIVKPSARQRIDGVIALLIALYLLSRLPARRGKSKPPRIWTPGGFVPAPSSETQTEAGL